MKYILHDMGNILWCFLLSFMVVLWTPVVLLILLVTVFVPRDTHALNVLSNIIGRPYGVLEHFPFHGGFSNEPR